MGPAIEPRRRGGGIGLLGLGLAGGRHSSGLFRPTTDRLPTGAQWPLVPLVVDPREHSRVSHLCRDVAGSGLPRPAANACRATGRLAGAPTAGHAGLRCGGVVPGLDGNCRRKNLPLVPGGACQRTVLQRVGRRRLPSASKVCRGSTRALASGLTGRSCCRGPGRIDSRAVLGVAPADAPRGTPERRGPRSLRRPMRQETRAGGRPQRPMPKRLNRSGLFP